MLRAMILPLVLVAVALAGCGGGADRPAGKTPHRAAPGAVSMKNLRFAPRELRVKVGRAVTWRNNDSVDHNVTATGGAHFASRAFGEGGSYRFTPRQAGTIAYVCTLHPGMRGRLLVAR